MKLLLSDERADPAAMMRGRAIKTRHPVIPAAIIDTPAKVPTMARGMVEVAKMALHTEVMIKAPPNPIKRKRMGLLSMGSRKK